MFSTIIAKYFAKYKDSYLKESVDNNELNAFVSALSITDKDLKDVQSKEYRYIW